MEDEQILTLYWRRDSRAIEASQEKYGAYCLAVSRGILADRRDCEECVSDTWLHAWQAIPPHRPAVLRMFLAKITRRLSFNRWKANTAQKRGGGQVTLALEELAECLAEEASVEDTVIARELAESVGRFVRGLPQREGDVFTRRYFFTEAIPDIARRYGLTANHTTVLLSRTRQKLRRHLEEEGYLP